MLAIASQTAGPNGLKFLEKPVSTSGVAKAKKDFIKKSILFFQKSIFFCFTFDLKKFHEQRQALQLVIIIMK